MSTKPYIALPVLEDASHVLLWQTLVGTIEHKREVARLICLVHGVEVVLCSLILDG